MSKKKPRSSGVQALRPEIHPDVAELVSQLMAATPRKRHALHRALIERVRDDPSVAVHLPRPADVPATGPREDVSDLHALAIRQRGDAAALRKHFKELDRMRASASKASAIGIIANGGPRAPFVAIIAPYIDDPNPWLRWWTSYFLREAALREHVELARWAKAMVSRVIDSERPKGSSETVAVEARRALRAALGATAQRARFEKAARSLLAAAEPKAKKALRTQLRALLPEALD